MPRLDKFKPEDPFRLAKHAVRRKRNWSDSSSNSPPSAQAYDFGRKVNGHLKLNGDRELHMDALPTESERCQKQDTDSSRGKSFYVCVICCPCMLGSCWRARAQRLSFHPRCLQMFESTLLYIRAGPWPSAGRWSESSNCCKIIS